jgi:hypothetical protein
MQMSVQVFPETQLAGVITRVIMRSLNEAQILRRENKPTRKLAFYRLLNKFVLPFP